jgi:CDP-glucose 4,6-dehydratase
VTASPNPDFWPGKRVLLTGHTGFVGGWAALWLERLGAEVTGLGLRPEESDNLYTLAGVAGSLASQLVDVRDRARVMTLVEFSRFDLVLHFAGATRPKACLDDPPAAFAIDVMGTVNLLEALRRQTELKAVLVATSTDGYARGAGEDGGQDTSRAAHPYVASKAACEIAVKSYARTFFKPNGVAVAIENTGDIVGGGDYAPDRATAAILRSAHQLDPSEANWLEPARELRHVLDAVRGCLLQLEALAGRPFSDVGTAGALEPSRVKDRLDPQQAISWTLEWHRAVSAGASARETILNQIEAYERLV